MKDTLALLLIVCQVFAATVAPPTVRTVLSLTYTSPAPGAQHISPTTSLAFRQGAPFGPQQLRPELFSITGSKSGRHSGAVRLSDDHLTLVYYPDQPFAFDETVSVTVQPGLATASGAPIASTSFQFSTLEHPMPPLAIPQENAATDLPPASQPALQTAPRYYTYPEFSNVMTTTVTTPAHGTAHGYIFVAGMGIAPGSDPVLLIVDNNGEPIYVQRTPSGLYATDFKRQVVHGVPYLTYYAGIPLGAWANGRFYVMDQSYTVVNSWTIGNGYGADLHELQLLNGGHALLESYVPIPADLTPYGGPADGTVIDVVVQEQDSAKNVVLEWHASQHVALTDTYQSLSSSPVDFIHINAIDVDLDGNLLISCRDASTVLKVDRQTGAVIWRLGGKSNQFTFSNDGGFSYQHDIRRLADGDITLFDNGNLHQPPASRGVEYALDEATKTITRTWQYADSPTKFAGFMGDVQRLSNGNTLIGWGAVPQVTEVLPDGSKVFEMALGTLSYRAFRFTWSALPAEKPRAAVIGAGDPTTATVYSSWNGATEISGYQIYGGPSPSAMSLITTTARTGFETATTLTGLDPTTCVMNIRPVSQLGLTTPFSANVYRTDVPGCKAALSYDYFPLVMGP